MTLSAHDQRELADIEHRLSGSDPGLALLLATFTRLTAGKEMPVREKDPGEMAAPELGSHLAAAGPAGRPRPDCNGDRGGRQRRKIRMLGVCSCVRWARATRMGTRPPAVAMMIPAAMRRPRR